MAALVLSLLTFFPVALIAQEKNHWLDLTIVAENRLPPLYQGGGSSILSRLPGRYFNQDLQLTGLVAGLDIRKNIYRHRIECSYGIRFKYGHLLYDGVPNAGLNRSINAWTADHILSICGRIPVGTKKEIRVALGQGFMNRGSDYATTEVDSLGNGQVIKWTFSGDFRYVCDQVLVGYNVNGLEAGITGYHAAESNYDNTSPFWLLGIFLKYDIWK